MLYPAALIIRMENQGFYSEEETVKLINFPLGLSPRKEMGNQPRQRKFKPR